LVKNYSFSDPFELKDLDRFSRLKMSPRLEIWGFYLPSTSLENQPKLPKWSEETYLENYCA
jgi:hypothetical protein